MTKDIYQYLLASVPPAVLIAAILRLLLRTEVRTRGRRRVEADGVHYVFAIHNAEELPLEGLIRLRLEVVLDKGRMKSMPTLLSGPVVRDSKPTFNPTDARSFEFSTSRMRAQSTWILLCSTNGQEGDLRLVVSYEKKSGEKLKRQQTWVQLGSSHDEMAMPSRWPWMLVGTLLALLTYALPIQFELSWPLSMRIWESPLDGVLIGVLLVCSMLAYWMCRPRPGPVILGHMEWEQKKESEVPSSGSS